MLDDRSTVAAIPANLPAGALSGHFMVSPATGPFQNTLTYTINTQLVMTDRNRMMGDELDVVMRPVGTDPRGVSLLPAFTLFHTK